MGEKIDELSNCSSTKIQDLFLLEEHLLTHVRTNFFLGGGVCSLSNVMNVKTCVTVRSTISMDNSKKLLRLWPTKSKVLNYAFAK